LNPATHLNSIRSEDRPRSGKKAEIGDVPEEPVFRVIDPDSMDIGLVAG
jgi:hypothetical protein